MGIGYGCRGLCIFFTIHFQVAHSDTIMGICLEYLQSRETSPKFLLEKFRYVKKKHPSSHPRKTRNCHAVMPFSVLVFELLFG